MSEDAAKQGAKEAPKKSRKTIYIVIIALMVVSIIGYLLYRGRTLEEEPAQPKGLLLGEHVKFLEEKSRIADYIVFEYMIQLEKLQRTINLDVELAGRRAECYGEEPGPAQAVEKNRIQAEIKRLKNALDDSRKEADKIREKLSFAKKEHMMKKDNQP